MASKKYRRGIIAIVLNDSNQFLLVRLRGKGKGDWNFPGGGVENDETFEECLWREMEEEIDLDKSQLRLLGRSKDNRIYKYNPRLLKEKRKQDCPYIGQEKAQYVLRLVNGNHRLIINKDEFTGFKWVDFKDLKSYLLFPGQYENAIKVLKELVPEACK
jgi:putative (di)nucleoside polyphosphate hydrolase